MPTETAADAITLAQIIKDYGPVVPWSLVIIGWFVANSQANVREKRKEARSEIEQFKQQVHVILEKYREYLEADVEPARKHAISIKSGINRLLPLAERLTTRLEVGELRSGLGDLFERITGGDFESSEQKPTLDNNRLLVVVTHAESMITLVENAFLKKFK
ncbi:MAG: hypothetical protein AB1642_05570 [Pseudomonadota bacterium]